MAETGIEWTDVTWNPATGCTKVSAGCKNCYADALARRLQAMGNVRYRNGFELTLHPDKVGDPYRWREPKRVFVNSMSDLLHRDIPTGFIVDVFRTMVETPRHTYQVLTKRPERWAEIDEAVVSRWGRWPTNVWPGATVEHRQSLPRLAELAMAGDERTVRMVSAEPLLESLAYRTATKWVDEQGEGISALAALLRDARIGWVITGGEAGWNARPAHLDWFREVRDACAEAGVAFFHKQHGGVGVTKKAKSGGEDALLDGLMHHAWPRVSVM